MPYSTLADLQLRFSDAELAQLTNPGGATDAAKVTRAIADGDAIIDSYLAKSYTLPLPQIPTRLNECSAHLARYALYDHNPPETITKRFEFEIAWLKSIARGDATLGIDEASEPPRTDSGIKISAPPRVFSQDGLSDYRGGR